MPGTFSVPGAHAALVAAAVNHAEPTARADSCGERTSAPSAFGPVELVSGDRGDIDVHLVHVDRNFADRLHRVGVENDAALAADLANFGDRLQDANLVVGGHDRDQDRLVIDGALQIVEIDQPVFLHRQIGHAEAVASPGACRCREPLCVR